MSGEIYEHFSHDERDFVDKASDWVEQAGKYHDMKLTDFLDPRQVFILQTLANRRNDVQIRLDGGYEAAERKRALVAPDYMYLDDEDMGMQVLSITSDDQKISEAGAWGLYGFPARAWDETWKDRGYPSAGGRLPYSGGGGNRRFFIASTESGASVTCVHRVTSFGSDAMVRE